MPDGTRLFTALRVTAASMVIAIGGFATVALTTQAAAAATDVVTNCNGSGSGSLPAVVASAASGDTITFSVSCPPSSPITLASTIRINENLTINGPGATDLVVSGSNAVEDFYVASTTVSISAITIEDGSSPTGLAGGGIYNGGSTLTIAASTLSGNSASGTAGGIYNNGGSLSITASTLSGNSASAAGGIYNEGGSLSITASTLSGNSASGTAGGIYNDGGSLSITDSTLSNNDAENAASGFGGAISNVEGGSVTVSNSTLSNNEAGHSGGGINNQEGAVTISDSTFSGDSANTSGGGGDIISSGSGNKVTAAATIFANSPSGGDCGATGVVVDEGYNLADDHSCKFNSATSKSGLKPHLGPLRNNGGPTETQSPAIGSPVLDQIPPSATGNGITLCSSTDQRGVPRPKKTNCDIGAVEMERDLATVDKHFSFTFITFGTPVPTITEKGALPQKLTFTDNGDGTATISGKPKTSGTYHLTIKATFGTGPTKYVVKQAFTLTVDSG